MPEMRQITPPRRKTRKRGLTKYFLVKPKRKQIHSPGKTPQNTMPSEDEDENKDKGKNRSLSTSRCP